MTTSHPFQQVNEDSMHIDYEAYIDLPTLDGKDRSIVVRLSFDKEKQSAYSTLTYEVDGSHTDLSAVSEDGITRNLYNEITGAQIARFVFTHRVSSQPTSAWMSSAIGNSHRPRPPKRHGRNFPMTAP